MQHQVVYIFCTPTGNVVNVLKINLHHFCVFHDFLTGLRHRHLFHSKNICPPPLPYFKVNIYPFPLPHFASIYFDYLWSFRWPNYIVTLPRYFSFRLPYLNIPTGPPQTNWTRIISDRGLVKISTWQENQEEILQNKFKEIFFHQQNR
jgi:hypothetical protein